MLSINHKKCVCVGGGESATGCKLHTCLQIVSTFSLEVRAIIMNVNSNLIGKGKHEMKTALYNSADLEMLAL